MTYKIKKSAGVLARLGKMEKSWEMKRAEARKEREKYQEIKRKHEAKLNKIYEQEKKKLSKEKEAQDEIERIKQMKDKARREIYGLTPKEKAQQQKDWEQAKGKVWGSIGKVVGFVAPEKAKKIKLTKAEKKEQKEIDVAWGDI